MRCRNCGKKGYIYIPYLKEHLCKKCFVRMVEKRVRLNLRKSLLSGDRDKVSIVDNNNAATMVCKHYLPKVFGEMYGSKLVVGKRRSYKLFVCRSLEEECVSFFRSILLNKPYKRTLNPTVNLPRREIEEYCKIKDLRFERQLLDSDVLAFLRELEDARPGAMFGTIKAVNNLDNRLR
jgi:hypothetical protein